MKTKNVDITEENFEMRDSREMTIKLIDAQINNYKLKFMTDWERDHSTSPVTKNSKIEALQAKKQEIAELFARCDSDDSLVDLNISIGVTIKKDELSIAV